MSDEAIVAAEVLPPEEDDDPIEIAEAMRGEDVADQVAGIPENNTVSLEEIRRGRAKRKFKGFPKDLADTRTSPRGLQQLEVFFQGLQLSANIRTSAAYAGIPVEVVASWIKKGRDGTSEIHVDFLERIERTISTFEMTHLGVLHEAAASGNAKASMWLLERVMPAKYGRDERLRIGVNDEKHATLKVRWPDMPMQQKAQTS